MPKDDHKLRPSRRSEVDFLAISRASAAVVSSSAFSIMAAEAAKRPDPCEAPMRFASRSLAQAGGQQHAFSSHGCVRTIGFFQMSWMCSSKGTGRLAHMRTTCAREKRCWLTRFYYWLVSHQVVTLGLASLLKG